MKKESGIINKSIKNQKHALMFLIFLFSIYYLLFNSFPVRAQLSLPSVGDIRPAVSLNSDPVTPTPNSSVTVTANVSGLTGGGNSNYSWYLNGAIQSASSGINKNVLTFKTGAIGTAYRVSVSVIAPNGENLTDALNLTVSDADLTWITNTEAPASYRAKLMPTQNSIVTISALPYIFAPGTKSQIYANNLIYNWIIDGKLDQEGSGIGKNIYIFKVNNFFGNSYNVNLEIKTSDGTVSLEKFINIPVLKPQILTYYYDITDGQPFGIALKDLITKPVDLNFIAEPYFFTTAINNLKWQWFVNNEGVNSNTNKPWLASLNLTNESPGQFSAQIRVAATNPNYDLESGQSIISLQVR